MPTTAATPEDLAGLSASTAQALAAHQQRIIALESETAALRKLLTGATPAPVPAPVPAPSEPSGATVLRVAPDGNDSADGISAPLTLQRSQELIRAARASGQWPSGGFVVILAPGRYELQQPLRLDGRDSGTAEGPVVYRGSTVDGVRASRIVGSVQLLGMQRSDVAGRPDLVRITVPGLVPGAELLRGGRLMTVARWPNSGYARIEAVSGRSVTLAGQPAISGPVTLEGFVEHTWRFDRLAASASGSIVAVDSGNPVVGRNAFLSGSIALLDSPDEYVIEAGAVVVSRAVADDPTLAVTSASAVIEAADARYVRFETVEVGECIGTGVDVQAGESVVLRDVEICNTGGDGVRLIGGSAHGVERSYIHDTGAHGVYAIGGNRASLTPGRLFVETCWIERTGRVNRAYSPAVATQGVGSVVRGNVIRDIPHVGLIFTGNDHLIELNEITDVVREAGDMGAIYSGRDWAYRGNVIRGNLIYDIAAPVTGDPRGIYLDDQFSSATVEANIFSAVKFGVFLGGGRDNAVRRNAFFACEPAVFFDARGLDNPALIAGNKPQLEAGLSRVPVTSAVWVSRFPEVGRLMAEEPMAPRGNRINDNVYLDCTPLRLQGASPGRYLQDPVGQRIDTGRQWSGRPTREWLESLDRDIGFPWPEFETLNAAAHAAKATA